MYWAIFANAVSSTSPGCVPINSLSGFTIISRCAKRSNLTALKLGSAITIQTLLYGLSFAFPFLSGSKLPLIYFRLPCGSVVSSISAKSTFPKSASIPARRSLVSSALTALSSAAKSCIFRYEGSRVISSTRLPSSSNPNL